MRSTGNRMFDTALMKPPLTLLAESDSTGATSQQMLAGVLVVLGIAIIAILISVSARSKMAKRDAERPTPRERIDQIKAAGGRHQTQAAPHAEHLDRLRELAIVLDNKAERLDQLLAEADERIARLRALGAAAEEKPAVTRLSAAPLDPLARAVYDLADSGRSPVEIAKELDEQVGKVDLILALRER